MRQVRIGDITIDAVIEREGPWRRPQDFFPAYDEAVFKGHLPSMEPEVFDQALVLLRHKRRRRLTFCARRRQHGHRCKVLMIASANRLRMVAIEFGM